MTELEVLAIKLRLPSYHAAARQLVLTALATSETPEISPAIEQELLSIRADVLHLTEEISELRHTIAALIRLQAAFTELLLTNIGRTAPDETAKVITLLIEQSFEET